MLISRRFLETLDASGLCEVGPNGTDRPLPRVALKDAIFGEEALAANAIVPEKLTEFEKGRTLSAREAVQIAREEMGDIDLRAKGAFGNLHQASASIRQGLSERPECSQPEGSLEGLHKASSAAQRGLPERLEAPEASPASQAEIPRTLRRRRGAHRDRAQRRVPHGRLARAAFPR